MEEQTRTDIPKLDDVSLPIPTSPAARRAVVLVAVLGTLALALVLFRGLDAKGPASWHEGVTLASSQETWLRGHAGVTDAWLVPTIYGEPRVVKPPLVVWLNLLAWTDLDPASASPRQLMLRARVVSVLLGLATLLGIVWMGHTLGDVRLGLLAAGMAGTIPLFQKHARMSSYDICMLCFATLTVASALWAMRPGRSGPSRVRAFGGWSLAAVFFALACLSKGPICLVVIASAVLPAIVLDGRRWRSSLIGFLASTATGLALAGLWYLELKRASPQAWASLGHEYGGPSWDQGPVWWYLVRLHLALPWILWLIGGLFHPFLRARGAARRARLVSWIWFVAVLAVFSLAPAKAPRYILPALPALALLAAFVWRDHAAFALRGTPDPQMSRLAIPHWVGMIVVSILPVLAPLLVALDDRWNLRGIESEKLQAIGWLAGIALTAGLTTMAVIGWRWYRRSRILPAAAVAVGWSILFTNLYWKMDAAAPDAYIGVEQQARVIAELIGEKPLHYYRRNVDDDPAHRLVFALQEVVTAVGEGDLEALTRRPARPIFVMATVGADEGRLEVAGFEPVHRFSDWPHTQRVLWSLR